MNRLVWLVAVLAVALVAGCGQKMVTVSSGSKIVCSDCSKVMSSDIKMLQVKAEDAAKYSVRETIDVCSSCEAKLDAKRQEEARKREAAERRLARERAAEERELARQRAAQDRGRVVGTWVCRFGGIFGDAVVHLRSDGTGDWVGPDASVRWSHTSEGFSATASWTEGDRARQSRFSGQVSGDGSRLVVHGWGIMGFSRSDNTIFERM